MAAHQEPQVIRAMLAGALTVSLNAICWTLIAAALGRRGEAVLGVKHVAALAACGAFGGAAYALSNRFWKTSPEDRRYGPWLCAGVTVMFAVVPANALVHGQDLGVELAAFVATPSMVVLYLVGGVLGGYMAGRWWGALTAIGG